MVARYHQKFDDGIICTLCQGTGERFAIVVGGFLVMVAIFPSKDG